MKVRAAAASLACALLGALPMWAAAEDHGQACREQRLRGLYVFAASGFSIVGGAALPKAIVEMIAFNGDGSTVTTPGVTLSFNGSITQLAQGSPGTYTFGTDCRGTLTFASGPTFDFTADLGGGTLWMIQTNPGNVFQGSAKRLSR